MSSTGLASDHRDLLAPGTLPRHVSGVRRACSLARGGSALNRYAFRGGPRLSQETPGKTEILRRKASGKKGGIWSGWGARSTEAMAWRETRSPDRTARGLSECRVGITGSG